MISFSRISLMAMLLSSLSVSPLAAQTVADDSAPEALLDIPGGQQLFAQNNPNVRRATAVINGEIITGTDIDERLALILDANKGKLPEAEVQRFRSQILSNLIDETLQIQEAKANEIEITADEVDQYLERISQQNFNRAPAALEKYLKTIGASVTTLKRQIKGELTWSRLLRRNVEPFINVSDDEVNAIVKRINTNKGTAEYHLGEIYLSATPENQEQVYANAAKVLEQLRKGGSFSAYARQFSEASTAVVGGDLDWLTLAQLPQSLAEAAARLNQNEVVAVPSPGGISLLVLIDKRQIATADPRDSVLSLKQIAINFPKGTNGKEVEPLVKRFNEETQKINGCGAADDMAKRLGAEVVNRDGLRVRELPGPLQQVMLDLQIGQSTPPYGSLEEGVRVFVICGRDAPESATGPSFEKIMADIEQERVNKRARIYLRDLRRDAVIDYN
jgi:peptidyl-prolyl cis-trans isomerase SurA